jgi:hypothetical protein
MMLFASLGVAAISALNYAVLITAYEDHLPHNVTTVTTYYNITAIVEENRLSVFQCWQLPQPFFLLIYDGPLNALQLALGDACLIYYGEIPPTFDHSAHNAPVIQWVFFLSGITHVTLPNTTVGPETELWIQGGKYGAVFAADTADIGDFGHITTHSSDASTTLLQIGVKDNEIPEHRFLYNGPCRWSEMAGV